MKTITPRFPQTNLSQLQARSGTPDGDAFATSILANVTTRIIMQPADDATAEEIAADIGAGRE